MKKLQDDLLANKVPPSQTSCRHAAFFLSPFSLTSPFPPTPGPADRRAGAPSAGVGSAESEARWLLFQVSQHFPIARIR